MAKKILPPSLELIKKTFDLCNQALCITDPQLTDHPVIYINQAFTGLTGFKAREIIGQNCRFLQANDRENNNIELIQRSIANHATLITPVRNYRKNGELFWNRLSIKSVFDESSGKSYFVGAQQDITEQMVERQRLLNSTEYLEQIAENSQKVFWLLELNNLTVLYVNSAYEKIWEHSKDRLYRRKFAWTDPIPHEEREKVFQEFLTAIEKRQSHFTLKYNIVRSDGSIRHIKDSGFLIKDKSGKNYRIARFAEDITNNA